jgi:RNA polymerase sigma-70 factor (ECF subfamily)
MSGLPTARKDASLDPASAVDADVLDHLGTLRKLSLHLARNRTDADDLVQETYLHALRASSRFQPGTNLRAWLRTILKNLASNRRRDDYRSPVRIDEAAVSQAANIHASKEASPEQTLLSRVVAPRLQRALESMPKTLRDAVWLRDVEELSYAEIASRLRIPIGTVMSRISRGRRLLHDRLLACDDGSTL